MEVKGTGLLSLKDFIKEKYPNQYELWVKKLSQEGIYVFSSVINSSEWFSISEVYYPALKAVSDMFFEGNQTKAAYEVGLYSAKHDLTGVYKVFLLIGTPQFLMKASKRIIATYYRPVDVDITEIQKNSLVLSVSLLHLQSEMVDYLTIAWCVSALELANCKNVTYEKIEAKNKDMFSFKLVWG